MPITDMSISLKDPPGAKRCKKLDPQALRQPRKPDASPEEAPETLR